MQINQLFIEIRNRIIQNQNNMKFRVEIYMDFTILRVTADLGKNWSPSQRKTFLLRQADFHRYNCDVEVRVVPIDSDSLHFAVDPAACEPRTFFAVGLLIYL